MECFICEVKGERMMLFDAIVREGVVKICEDCSVKEGIPVIRRVSDLQLKESEKNQSVYEKLSKMAGIDPEEHKAKFEDGGAAETLRRQNEDLRKIVEKKRKLSFPELKQVQSEPKDDLIRNYHWAIFKARRARRLTRMQVAEAIAEPEASIKLAERGILPDNYHGFIRKLQTFLGVSVFNKPIREIKELGFDSVSAKTLTISDLQEVKEKVDEEESKSFFPYWRKKLGFLQGKREESEEEIDEVDLEEVEKVEEQEKEVEKKEVKESKGELSKEDMDKIIFGG